MARVPPPPSTRRPADRTDPAAYPVVGVDLTPIYGDLDAGGHVGVHSMARFFEHTRFEWHIAIGLLELRAPGSSLLVARSCVEHLAPAHLGAPVHARLRVARLGSSSVVEEMAAWQGGSCIALAEVVMVHSSAGRSTPLPEALRAAFAGGLAAPEARAAGHPASP
jgi:acyl-CoA thioester hydrolase